jgi:hypothetical protein
MSSRWPLFALQCSMLAACGHSGETTCTSDDMCASHFCRADGTCGPAQPDAPAMTDAPADTTAAACTPNHDGTISSNEVPLRAGASANFRIATNATWDTAGTSGGSGSRSWDLTGQLANDADTAVALTAPTGQWWAADFTTASYSTPLSASSDLLGVFQISADGLVLLGVVSPSAGSTKTEITYDPPARILSIPFKAGDTWTTTSTVSGYVSGVIGAYTEQYDSRVDQVGTLKAPYGDFPVLRIATDMTRTSGVATLASNRTFTWAAECFGFVATVQSQNLDTSAEFSDDAEVRRLIP